MVDDPNGIGRKRIRYDLADFVIRCGDPIGFLRGQKSCCLVSEKVKRATDGSNRPVRNTFPACLRDFMFTMIHLPNNWLTILTGNTSTIAGELSPIILVLAGLYLAFWIIRSIIGLFNVRAAEADLDEWLGHREFQEFTKEFEEQQDRDDYI